MTRVLTIMGSGETAPTMAKVHRQLIGRAGRPAVLLDTPYGFQENADEISSRAIEYFRESVGAEITVASFRRGDVEPLVAATAGARIREANYVFAGPGSPTYTLRQWASSDIPALLAEKLATGGAVTFASAAALTLGRFTVPVYEVYKCGEEPAWRPGLDLLAPLGFDVAVIPHYDNAEGGHHDTRFCYLGERRLALLETSLPDDGFVLGLDEHTGAIIDIDAATATVVGLGVMTVRKDGRSVTFPTGSTVTLDEIRAAAEGRPAGGGAADPVVPGLPAPHPEAPTPVASSPLLSEAARLEAQFTSALEARSVDEAVAAVLELDGVLLEWSRDTLQSDEPDRVRAQLHAMVVRLGELARTGARDPREVVGPVVEALLVERADARAQKDWPRADRIRDGLVTAGIEVRDTPEGSRWDLAGG